MTISSSPMTCRTTSTSWDAKDETPFRSSITRPTVVSLSEAHHAAQMSGPPLLVSYFDASLGKSNRAQQGELHLMTTTAALHTPAPACMLEFRSNRIHRVARSSLAAEGCAMSSAGDRQLFNRMLLDALLYGKTHIGAWNSRLPAV